MSSFPGSILLSGAQIMAETTKKIHPLGTRGYTRDGRVFRYTRNGGVALKSGEVCQSAVPSAYAVLLDSGTTKISANSSKMTLVTSGNSLFTTKNAYADGYAWLRTSSTAKGAGQYCQIKSHSTESLTATGLVVFNFQAGDEFYAPSNATAMGTTGITVGLIRNPYDKIVVKPSGIVTAPIVGVPVRPVSVNTYFWLQTWGPCPVRGDAVATKIGRTVGVSTDTSARFSGINSTKNTSAVTALYTWTFLSNVISAIGVQMIVGVSGEYRMVHLKIAP